MMVHKEETLSPQVLRLRKIVNMMQNFCTEQPLQGAPLGAPLPPEPKLNSI